MPMTNADRHRLMYGLLYASILGAGLMALRERTLSAWEALMGGKPWTESPQIDSWSTLALAAYLVVFFALSYVRALRIEDKQYGPALFGWDLAECLLMLARLFHTRTDFSDFSWQDCR